MTNIETPEGWQRSGKFLFRQYGESFATIVQDDQEDWAVNVSLPDGGSNQDWYGSLDKAIAEANEQLGVPKPVEVVEIECEDGVLLYSEDRKRSCHVHQYRNVWYCTNTAGERLEKQSAIEAARRYVRGDA